MSSALKHPKIRGVSSVRFADQVRQAGDVHERERCEDGDENGFSCFCHLSRRMTKLKHPCLSRV